MRLHVRVKPTRACTDCRAGNGNRSALALRVTHHERVSLIIDQIELEIVGVLGYTTLDEAIYAL